MGRVPVATHPPGTSTDRREAILRRVQALLKTLAPGVAFPLLGGVPHETIMSNLGGRAYSKPRAEAQVDSSEMPYVVIMNSASQVDTVEPLNDETYGATMRVEIEGYCKAEDQGDGLDAAVREQLNALRADVIIAMHSLPYWVGTEPDQIRPLQALIGPVIVLLKSQWTEPATGAPDGFLVLEFDIKYLFTMKNP